jgi:F-type H+-transporting ATPase subunit c
MANAQEPEPTAAPEQQVDNTASFKAIAAALTIGLAAAAGALAMGIAISKADEKIRGSLLLGLIFIETAIIYALVVAILIIFVL